MWLAVLNWFWSRHARVASSSAAWKVSGDGFGVFSRKKNTKPRKKGGQRRDRLTDRLLARHPTSVNHEVITAQTA